MMKAIILVLCLAVAVSAFSDMESAERFSAWCGEHGKVYDQANLFERYNIWRANTRFIEDTNKEGHSYTLKMNEFGDQTLDEFVATHLKLQAPKKVARGPVPVRASVPDSKDWRQEGAVTPVKDQGQCGSCWAFSAIGAIESRCWIKHHPATQDILSEQELVDCSAKYGNEGCRGGWMDYAFAYAKDNGGVAASADYAYKAVDQKCQSSGKKHWCKLTGWEDVPENDQSALKTAVADGPVAVAIEADTSVFQFYSSGVIDSSACGTELDHGVLAVGYGKMSGKDMWIVKNSWGKSWGANGYVYIARNDAGKDEGICGIAEKPSYPIIGEHQ